MSARCGLFSKIGEFIQMPEDLPKAVLILLWLLIGVIVFGYLVMEHTVMSGIVFAIIFYGMPILWHLKRKNADNSK